MLIKKEETYLPNEIANLAYERIKEVLNYETVSVQFIAREYRDWLMFIRRREYANFSYFVQDKERYFWNTYSFQLPNFCVETSMGEISFEYKKGQKKTIFPKTVKRMCLDSIAYFLGLSSPNVFFTVLPFGDIEGKEYKRNRVNVDIKNGTTIVYFFDFDFKKQEVYSREDMENIMVNIEKLINLLKDVDSQIGFQISKSGEGLHIYLPVQLSNLDGDINELKFEESMFRRRLSSVASIVGADISVYDDARIIFSAPNHDIELYSKSRKPVPLAYANLKIKDFISAYESELKEIEKEYREARNEYKEERQFIKTGKVKKKKGKKGRKPKSMDISEDFKTRIKNLKQSYETVFNEINQSLAEEIWIEVPDYNYYNKKFCETVRNAYFNNNSELEMEIIEGNLKEVVKDDVNGIEDIIRKDIEDVIKDIGKDNKENIGENIEEDIKDIYNNSLSIRDYPSLSSDHLSKNPKKSHNSLLDTQKITHQELFYYYQTDGEYQLFKENVKGNKVNSYWFFRGKDFDDTSLAEFLYDIKTGNRRLFQKKYGIGMMILESALKILEKLLKEKEIYNKPILYDRYYSSEHKKESDKTLYFCFRLSPNEKTPYSAFVYHNYMHAIFFQSENALRHLGAGQIYVRKPDKKSKFKHPYLPIQYIAYLIKQIYANFGIQLPDWFVDKLMEVMGYQYLGGISVTRTIAEKFTYMILSNVKKARTELSLGRKHKIYVKEFIPRLFLKGNNFYTYKAITNYLKNHFNELIEFGKDRNGVYIVLTKKFFNQLERCKSKRFKAYTLLFSKSNYEWFKRDNDVLALFGYLIALQYPDVYDGEIMWFRLESFMETFEEFKWVVESVGGLQTFLYYAFLVYYSKSYNEEENHNLWQYHIGRTRLWYVKKSMLERLGKNDWFIGNGKNVRLTVGSSRNKFVENRV